MVEKEILFIGVVGEGLFNMKRKRLKKIVMIQHLWWICMRTAGVFAP